LKIVARSDFFFYGILDPPGRGMPAPLPIPVEPLLKAWTAVVLLPELSLYFKRDSFCSSYPSIVV